MIEKTLLTPAFTKRYYRFPANEFKRGSVLRSVRLKHLKRRGDSFVCAEDVAKVYEIAAAPTKLFCTPSNNYAFRGNRLYFLEEGTSKTGFTSLNCMAEYADADGTVFVAAVANSRCFKIAGTTVKTLSTTVGGTCAAFHHERLFLGNGTRLYYSAAQGFDNIAVQDTQGAGYLDLPPDGLGEIEKIVPYRGKLYLFRRYGITAFTGYADTLNFKLSNVNCGGGKILGDSVACCGDKIYFFTERGLYAFDGSDCARLQDAEDEEIDLTAPVWGGSEGNDYFASVLVGGARGLYSYDSEFSQGRFINAPNDLLASCNEVYLLNGADVYKFNGQDVKYGDECAAELAIELPYDQKYEQYLESVTVEGEGRFTVTVSGGGASFAMRGDAGEFRLPKSLRGRAFGLKIAVGDKYFRFDGFVLGTRRERRL